jgi:ribose 5-phosphate isomerase B
MIAEHNNCQIVAMGARVVGNELGKMICDTFFDSQFQGGRHARRVGLIEQVEKDYGYADAEVK